MRVRASYAKDWNTIWVIFGVSQLIQNGFTIHYALQHDRHSWHMKAEWFSQVLWVVILAFYALHPLFDYWQVDADGIRYRKFFRARMIPFAEVVAIRSEPKVEIEVGLRGPDVYPHQYVTPNLSDRKAFLRAIELYAPRTLAA